MKFIIKILDDFNGIVRVCGLVVGIKWLFFILYTLPQCIKYKNLQPADKKLGNGPFKVRYGKAKASMIGEQVISGIREIWVRDVYLGNGFLSLNRTGLVLDLGANMGNFTILALASNSNSKIIAIEPSLEFNKKFKEQIRFNKWEKRVTIQRYFIGKKTEKQLILLEDHNYTDVKWLTIKDFIKINNLKKVDFLKCDIEGGEFEFINDSSLLEITDQIAVEVHAFAGDMNIFIKKLKELGFAIGPIKEDPGSCIVLAKKY